MSHEMVELHEAFFWTCPECGRDSFGRVVQLEVDAEKLEALRDQYGIPEPEEGFVDGKLLQFPNVVTCEHCLIEFDTEGPMTGIDE